jgi:RNA polymerase sigma-70 factor (sigma-E family)
MAVRGIGEEREDHDFHAVYAAHYDPLVRLAYLTTGSMPAAEDIVQEAFTDLYRRWSVVLEPAGWLRRAVVNRSVSWLRRLLVARRYQHRHRDDQVHPPPTAEHLAVRAALNRLTPRQRAAVFLRFYLDLPESEIAATLGCRSGTVKSLLSRALSDLRGDLNAD